MLYNRLHAIQLKSGAAFALADVALPIAGEGTAGDLTSADAEVQLEVGSARLLQAQLGGLEIMVDCADGLRKKNALQ